jgi:hypothetical protein
MRQELALILITKKGVGSLLNSQCHLSIVAEVRSGRIVQMGNLGLGQMSNLAET